MVATRRLVKNLGTRPSRRTQKTWPGWTRKDGIIDVASRGPQEGNGGVGAIGSAVNRLVPSTVFVHKAVKDNKPYITLTVGGEMVFVEDNVLDQETVDRARWFASAVAWFGLHGDWKNVFGFAELEAWTRWNEAQTGDGPNEFIAQGVEDDYRAVTARHEQGWEAIVALTKKMALVVYELWKQKRRPIIINDFDNCLVAKWLCEMDAEIADWILVMLHTPFPRKDSIPSFLLDLMKNIVDGMLGTGVRFAGMHTPRDRKNFGDLAADMGCTFRQSVMGIIHPNGRYTRLGQTLAGVDTQFFRDEGREQLNLAELTGLSWMADMDFIMKTDRMDDTLKNGRRSAEAIDKLFTKHPELKGKVVLLIIGFPSRSLQGIQVYDNYLANVQAIVDRINAKHRVGDWVPIVWLKKVVSRKTIAQLYGHRRCRGKFIASKDDGLHLGSVELSAANWWKLTDEERRLVGGAVGGGAVAEGAEAEPAEVESPEGDAEEDLPVPGLLWLSPGAGSFHYLGHRGAIEVDSRDPEQMAEALYAGLMMDPEECAFRSVELARAALMFDIDSMLDRILRQAALPLPQMSTAA